MATLKRSDVRKEDKWDLEKIYPSAEEFKKDMVEINELIPSLKEFKGKLNDVSMMIKFLELDEKIGRKIGKAYTYASNKYNEDLGNTDMQMLMQGASSTYSKYGEALSFVTPEILSLEEETFKGIMEDPRLKDYKFYFEKLKARKNHVLNEDRESAYASLSEIRNGSQLTYGILTNTELKFPEVLDSKGEKHTLTQSTYQTYIKSKDRVLRENAFKTLHNVYGEHENTLGSLLTTSMKDWNIDARVRNYESPVERALKVNNIPVSVFYNAIETINRNVDLLHRYVSLKKKYLNLDEIHMYDLYVSLAKGETKKYTFEEGVDIALKGLNAMGDEYMGIFKDGIENGWIDRYENQGKRSGAYSSGSYDTLPYILLNYKDTLGDISTLVHEMGHSMHSYYTRKFQPYIYGNYSIFLAEVASTCNEKLLIHHLISNSKDKNERLTLINQELEQIRATVYRQLMFAEFEMITHDKLFNGEALTASDYNEIYYNLNKKFFGEEMVVDKEIQSEWARIPHFYNDFYVYQYATGYAAASSFSKMILEKGGEAVESYINKFLKAGSSKYPVDVLKDAGVDMTTSKPLEDTLAVFKELLDLLEKEMGENN